MFIPPMPSRAIPWSAIVIGVLLTIDFGIGIYKNFTEKNQVATRIEGLNQQITEITEKTKAMPKTVTVVEKVTRQLPEPPMAAREVERNEASNEMPQAKKHVRPSPPRVVTETRTKTMPNPERVQAEKQLQDKVIEIEAEGFRFKMINEATWNMIFKVCFLWAFVLATLAFYKKYTAGIIQPSRG